MRAMMWVIVGLCGVVVTYMYVMALCYLCDVYEEKKRAKQEAEEKRRKQELHRALEQVETQRKQEVEQRKRRSEHGRLHARLNSNVGRAGTSTAIPL